MLEFHDRNLQSSIKELKLELILSKYSKDKENHHHHHHNKFNKHWPLLINSNDVGGYLERNNSVFSFMYLVPISLSMPMDPTVLRNNVRNHVVRWWTRGNGKLYIVGPALVMGSTSTMIMCARATQYWGS